MGVGARSRRCLAETREVARAGDDGDWPLLQLGLSDNRRRGGRPETMAVFPRCRM